MDADRVDRNRVKRWVEKEREKTDRYRIDSEWRELVERARLEKVVNGRERGIEGRDRINTEYRNG